MKDEEMRYTFGKNWAEFIDKNFSEERVRIAQEHLLNFLKLKDLRGKTFLDIGCGSGIHSFAACNAGAERIFSFDYDPNSVKTTEFLRGKAGKNTNWEIVQGSVLDKQFMDNLAKADIVYSWGVLHHTGSMWEAIENAAVKIKPDGVFYIALYTTDVYKNPTPEYWLSIKQKYNRVGNLGKKLMELGYAWNFDIKPSMKAPKYLIATLKRITNYQASRGMSYWTDVKDWLGGWPMEFAGIQETKNLCEKKLGLELLNINAGEANTEYLFRKKGAQNYWNDYKAGLDIIELNKPFQHRNNYAWSIDLPQFKDYSDSVEYPKKSKLMLFENDIPVGFAHIPHSHIEQHGGGRYSHWNEQLIFSATDNSDPNINDKKYSICLDML